MSLVVKELVVSELNSKQDRYLRLTFRGIPFELKSKVSPENKLVFNTTTWNLSSSLTENDYVHIHLYNKNKVLNDRLIGCLKWWVHELLESSEITVYKSLVNEDGNPLKHKISFSLKYAPPSESEEIPLELTSVDLEEGRVFIDLTSNSENLENNEAQNYSANEVLNNSVSRYSKVRLPDINVVEIEEWQVHVHIYKGKQLAGEAIDPVIDLEIDDKKESTSIRPQTNDPIWDEGFVFEFKKSQRGFLDTIFLLKVFTGRNVAKKGNMIGHVEFDLWTVYNEPLHMFQNRWAVLQESGSNEIRGYILMTVSVVGQGDELHLEKKSSSSMDESPLLLLPPDTQAPREVYDYIVTVHRAECIPLSSNSMFGSMMKAFGGKHINTPDTYVQVKFGCNTLKTKVVKGKHNPIFNEPLVFKDFFPPLFQNFKVQIRDTNAVSDESIGTHYININEIIYSSTDWDESSSILEEDFSNTGLVPTFGPSWINIYGSTRDFEKWVYMNEGYMDGNSFRGRLLLSIQCELPDKSNKKHHKKEIKEPLTAVTDDTSDFLLYTTIYDASMIERRFTNKQILFEITLGSNDLPDHMSQNANPSSLPSSRSSSTELLLPDHQSQSDEKGRDDRPKHIIDAFFYTSTYLGTVTSESRQFCHLAIGNEKPCTYIHFTHEDMRFRDHENIMIKKILYLLEDDLFDVKQKFSDSKELIDVKLRKLEEAMEHFSNNCDEYLKQSKSLTMQSATNLDRKIMSHRLDAIKKIKKKAKIIFHFNKKEDFEIIYHKCNEVANEFKLLLKDPRHSFPDVIVWLIAGGMRIGYVRVPAQDILYSKNKLKCGQKAGVLQTLFLQPPSIASKGRYQDLIQAKLEIRFWLGDYQDKCDLLVNAPTGYELPETNTSIPLSLIYEQAANFTMHAYLYEGRTVLASDDSGLSDPFAKVIFGHNIQETRIIPQTRTAVWDQMLVFNDVTFIGDIERFPPTIIIDVFDKDDDEEEEFLGRAIATPDVKESSGPYVPAQLQWLPIMIGNIHMGDVLAAFEIFPIGADNIPEQLPMKMKDGQYYCPIPRLIQLKVETYRVELMFWGVRELKRLQALKVMRPQIIADVCYDMRLVSTGKLHRKFRTKICVNAQRKPNFENPVVIFDVDLPARREYMPTFTFRVYEHRRFGGVLLVGNYTSDHLHNYFHPSKSYKSHFPNYNTKSYNALETLKSSENSYMKKPKTFQEKSNGNQKGEQETDASVLDWWTRFYVSMSETLGAESYHVSPEECMVPRIVIYDHELEKEFGNFNDFLTSFPITRGKQYINAIETDRKRTKGQIKGAIRIWKKHELPPYEAMLNDPLGTFQHLPSNSPVKILVRVYCVLATQLLPKDISGKADPFLVVQLGDKKKSDADHVSNTLEPEFGSLFEFEAVLPFDNLLTVQVFDWDLLPGSNDLIGETKIDIENRFFSKHRPTCGLPKEYHQYGCAVWRDIVKPTIILQDLCQKDGRGRPNYNHFNCSIDGHFVVSNDVLLNIDGNDNRSNEEKALEVLNAYENLPNSYQLVPEHVETRTLYHPDKPNLPQGKLMLWVDMFKIESTRLMMPPVDIRRRKPEEYELRVIVWNCEKVPLLEKSLVLGAPTSDICVRGWLEGMFEDKQKTDVHYRSTNGTGMFNWRFIFPLKYHKAKKQFVCHNRLTTFALEETEQFFEPLLKLQCLEADILTADVIGSLTIPLLNVPPCFAKPSGWSYKDYLKRTTSAKKPISLFKCTSVRGWWPFVNDDMEQGRVELEIDLVTKEDAEKNPVGRRREEPHALEKPNRPEESMRLFLSPLLTFKMLFDRYKWKLVKLLVVTLLLAVVALFIYALPGYLARKTLSV